MKKIFNKALLGNYIEKHKIEEKFGENNILQHAQLHFYKREESILKAETKLEYYYFLVEGKVKVFYLFENGKSMLLKFYQDFNVIGDIELLKNNPVRCNIDAVEDTFLIAIPTAVIREQYLDNINFLHHLIESLSEKLYATINNSSYNFVYPLINRLSTYLVEHMTDQDYIILNSTFNEIAQFLGTSYRHLNRTFKELESKSIIKCQNKTIYILNEGQLRELSKNPYLKTL